LCRTEFLGKCPARCTGLEDEDLAGSGEVGKLQGEEADGAGSEDKDTIAQLGGSSAYGMKGDGRGLDHGGIIHRQGIGNAHEAIGGNGDSRRIASVGWREGVGSVREGHDRSAAMGVSCPALRALTTGDGNSHDSTVAFADQGSGLAGSDSGSSWTDRTYRNHRPCPFMTT
jgi:hypothetical protein